MITYDAARRVFVLKAEIWLPAPRSQIFEFFSDAFQLETITPPWMNFHVAAERPLTIQAGTKIDYQLRIHGLPLRWQSLISVWEPPVRFIDEQLRGPYRMWHHEHRFSEENGGTLVTDEVQYRVPGGRLVNRLFVAPDLRKIFSYRTQKLQEIFGANR